MQNNLALIFTGGDLYHSKEIREGNITRQYIGSNLEKLGSYHNTF